MQRVVDAAVTKIRQPSDAMQGRSIVGCKIETEIETERWGGMLQLEVMRVQWGYEGKEDFR